MARPTYGREGDASSATRLRYAEYIAQALATPGGHLALGHGGVTLSFRDSRLSGCLPEQIKGEAIAGGLQVIDSRLVPFKLVWDLAVGGPMIAVNREPSALP